MKLDFEQLNKRQEFILELIDKKEKAAVAGLVLDLAIKFKKISRITIIRDLNKLLKFGLIKRQGKGRGVIYKLSPSYYLFKPINVDEYFNLETDKRKARRSFNFEIFKYLKDIFSQGEKEYLNKLLSEYRFNLRKISSDILKQEFERLTIDLSWKSSAIEGNTYTLLETESLIKRGEKAKGRQKEETIMVLNHKKTLDYIKKNLNNFQKISVSELEDIHQLLTKNLNIRKGVRKSIIGITGTVYQPLDNVYQIKEALEKTCQVVNKEKNVFAKAIILMLLIAYIQPFVDGNKRTGRLVANAVLMAYNACPLSYRNVDEEAYKKAIILFDEQNNLNYFKKLFIEQFDFAVKNYFRVHPHTKFTKSM